MPDTQCSQIFLGRQPILGREQQLLAYELLFREGPIFTSNRADIIDPSQATATVIANAFTELSANETLGPYRGYINVDQQFLFSDLIEVLPPALVVLEILESVQPTPEVVARCRELRGKGFTLAIDDVVDVGEAYRPLFELAEIIKVDILDVDAGRLAALVGQLKPFGKKLLAEKVESAEQVEQCKRLGFELFQGYYFAKPTIIAGKKLDHSQLSLMKLMGLLLGDADTAELEAALKPEPGLTVNLLRMTNSVGAGCSETITSLRHAITVLGRRQLQRWLQILVFASGSQAGSTNPLLMMAATRGRLMELLAGELRSGDAAFSDQAFMVGIMSLMPALVGQPIADIVAPLGLSAPVRDALCEQAGALGQLLQVAEASEGGDLSLLGDRLAALPGLGPKALNRAQTQALQWANSIAKDKG